MGVDGAPVRRSRPASARACPCGTKSSVGKAPALSNDSSPNVPNSRCIRKPSACYILRPWYVNLFLNIGGRGENRSPYHPIPELRNTMSSVSLRGSAPITPALLSSPSNDYVVGARESWRDTWMVTRKATVVHSWPQRKFN